MNDQLGFEELFGLWEEGANAVTAADPQHRGTIEAVVEVVVAELRKRLGGKFTTTELARYYLTHGTEWCFELATRTAPSTPEAWDVGAISGAAFARCARFASDFGGGRRVLEEG
jgi:hypothetical protein